MEIDLGICTLRPFREGDQASLAGQANNPKVVRHMRERFPQPYTLDDAQAWIALVANQLPVLSFAICIDDQPVGGIGLTPGSDVHRVSTEVGYWLGETHWGRGIATRALAGIKPYAFATFLNLNRLFAYVDEEHVASIRVLEKCGFRREGHFIGAAIKAGAICNQFVYGITRAEMTSEAEPRAYSASRH